MSETRRSILLILDGMGIADDLSRSAVTPQTMPFCFDLMRRFGCSRLQASEDAVGLAAGQAGNSEVGHLTIGAGRKLESSLSRIDTAYVNGSWERHSAWFEVAKAERVHIVTVLSEAGVHAHWRTGIQAAFLALKNGCHEVLLHIVLDGVDSPAGEARAMFNRLREEVGGDRRIRIASVCGRKWALDRSGNDDLTATFVSGLFGEAPTQIYSEEALFVHLQTNASEANFPFSVNAKSDRLRPGEPVILTNHRADRAHQTAELISKRTPLFSMIELKTCAAEGGRVFFPTQPEPKGLIDALDAHAISALRISEACKFPHVTWFINGRRNMSETAIKIQSIPESEIRFRPEMSLHALVDAVTVAVEHKKHRAIIVNIPNLDQVGHLGDKSLAEEAARLVDTAVQTIVDAAAGNDWSLVITADHGNADCMVSAEGAPFGSHSTNPVPLIVIASADVHTPSLPQAKSLSDVAGLYLETLGIPASALQGMQEEQHYADASLG